MLDKKKVLSNQGLAYSRGQKLASLSTAAASKTDKQKGVTPAGMMNL